MTNPAQPPSALQGMTEEVKRDVYGTDAHWDKFHSDPLYRNLCHLATICNLILPGTDFHNVMRFGLRAYEAGTRASPTQGHSQDSTLLQDAAGAGNIDDRSAGIGKVIDCLEVIEAMARFHCLDEDESHDEGASQEDAIAYNNWIIVQQVSAIRAILSESPIATEPSTIQEMTPRQLQAIAQCRAVAHMANALSEAHTSRAAILQHDPMFTEAIGSNTAYIMEVLGDALSNMDAVTDEDEWLDLVFERAHEFWPQAHESHDYVYCGCGDSITEGEATCPNCLAAHGIDPDTLKSDRYEYVRKLKPRQFAELCRRNLAGEGTFDDLVDQDRLPSQTAAKGEHR